MVRRHHKSKFMANAHVFPGGRVDEQDCAPGLAALVLPFEAATAARRLGHDDPAVALGFYLAAVRETLEEAGLLPGLGRAPGGGQQPGQQLARWRSQLNDHTLELAGLLSQLEHPLQLDQLRYLDHWVTPEFEHRRFSARFFICRAPPDQQASFDPHETTAGQWFTVAELLQGNSENRLHLAPPTLCILERLAPHQDVDVMLDAAPDRPLPATMPRPLIKGASALTLLLPGDHRYDDPESATGAVDCVELHDGHWVHCRQ